MKYPLANAGHLSGSQSPELIDAQQAAGVQSQEPPEVGIRALTGWEWAEVLRQAAEFATERGAKPDDADEVYQLGKMVHALALAVRDPDDESHPPFFDGGVGQILDSVDLGRDGIAYLFEQYETWQDMTHPQQLRMSERELGEAIEKLSGATSEALPFFLGLRRGTQFHLMHFSACLLRSSILSSSTIGGESAAPSENNGSSSRPPSEPA